MRNKLRLLGAIALAFTLFNTGIDFQVKFKQQVQPIELHLLFGDRADAQVRSGGRIRRQSALPDAGDPAAYAYMVVTLLVGTEDDRSILNPIHTAEELTAALQRLGSIAPNYFSVFELLWSLQVESDSLSYDAMLAAYPDLIQIA